LNTYEIKCLLCASVVGDVARGAVSWRPVEGGPLAASDGRLRCRRCGGSLFLEPVEARRLPITSTELIWARLDNGPIQAQKASRRRA
jgi:hypothetical protein